MKSLKKIIQHNLLWLTAVMMVLILLIALLFQVMSNRAQARKNADAMFVQVGQIIEKSTAELETVKADYETTCLLNAETISYIIQENTEILGNVEEFRQLAHKLEVDEIHIFTEKGRIFTGTHPEYFNFTFDSGEQMNFFKPMLEDKSLRLCQPITPNTAEGKLVQYSALWSADGRYIVQVGMYPDAVLEVTEKNELSYIFSLLRSHPGVSLYAVDSASGQIVGSTAGTDNGKTMDEIGLKFSDIEKFEDGVHETVNGVDSYCIFKNMDGTLIGYVIANDQLYSNIGLYTLMLALCLLVIAIVLVVVVQKYTERYIVGSISATNERLRAVSAGNLDERVDVQSSREFAELSSHINSMIRSLLSDTDKMSLVLNRTNLHIGVYEYNTKMKNVRFTEHIPEIFGLSAGEMRALATDYTHMQQFIDRLRREPVPGEENTYRFVGKKEMYIKLEEISGNNAILGIVMDVTEETVSRKRAEIERDIDLMTALYNRRGMERQFERLFADPAAMGGGALIMVDADNLKSINDNYGHAVGDMYLKQLADILRNFDAPCHLAARTGGDEFVLLIYGYSTDADVNAALERIREQQHNATVQLADGRKLPLQFSYGYELTHGRRDHENMLSVADAHMYNSKRMRKKAAGEEAAAEE